MKWKKFLNRGAGQQKVLPVHLLSKSVSVSQRECAGNVSSDWAAGCGNLKGPLACERCGFSPERCNRRCTTLISVVRCFVTVG